MSFDTTLVRQIVPKSYHFDGFNVTNCPNSRDKPFFSDNMITLEKYYLNTRLESSDVLSIEFSSICPKGEIVFKPYKLNLEEFVKLLQETVSGESDFIHFEVEVAYNKLSKCNNCKSANEACKQLVRRKLTKVSAAVSFNKDDIEKVLASYFGITKKKLKITTGGTNMKNNLFGMNWEYGISKDPNISSTLMGIAVKNRKTGSWYSYDKANGVIKNLANFKMGNFPIFMLPTKTLEVGDLTKFNGVYYYVNEIKPDGKLSLITPEDGMVREMLPTESIIPGMQLYTKLVAFDTSTLTDTTSNKNMSSNVLAAIFMMQWGNEKRDEFSLDNVTEDSFNGLGSYLPLLMANGGDFSGIFGSNDMNLPMLMALGSGGSDTDQFTQMMILTQLLGGNSPMNILGDSSENTQEVMCEKCGKKYPSDTNFCPECGEKTKPATNTCPKCGIAVDSTAKFCKKCGCKLSKEVCSKCGAEIESGDRFCSKCGNDLLAEPVPEVKEE